MSNNNLNNLKPNFHPKYRVEINWQNNEVFLNSRMNNSSVTVGSFTFSELDEKGRIILNDNDTIFSIKRTKKGDRLSFGILDKTVPEPQQSWKNYLTAKLSKEKKDYALFTFDD